MNDTGWERIDICKRGASPASIERRAVPSSHIGYKQITKEHVTRYTIAYYAICSSKFTTDGAII